MARTSTFPIVAESQVLTSVRLEPLFVLLSLALGSWIFYKVFLRDISNERHKIFDRHFKNLVSHIAMGLGLYVAFQLCDAVTFSRAWVSKAQIYIGLFAIAWGCIIFVKILRIIAYEYLFMTSKKAGVPLLLVNILMLIASVILVAWGLTTYFEIQLAPLLATSAVFSIVLGLALQDTLGNLFSAVALQLDKPFDLGDWIEVRSGSERISGQVQEVSWRATVLLAITDELITLPNRYMAQSQILNYSGREKPFCRSHLFRVPHGSSITSAKQALLLAANQTEGIALDPSPVVVITETTESWISLKVVYSISDYGLQYGVADRFLATALANLDAAGVKMATPRITIDHLSA